MAATVSEIRAGIAANITAFMAASPNPQALAQVSPYPVGSPIAPCAWVIRGGTEFDYTMQDDGQGTDEHTFIVQVFVALKSVIDGGPLLDQFAASSGPFSIKNAIETIDQPPNITLGGLVDDLRVTEISRDQIMRHPGVAVEALFLGHEYSVAVFAS